MNAPEKKKSKSLILLLCLITLMLGISIVAFMKGFHTFETFQPDTSKVMPPTPGFP